MPSPAAQCTCRTTPLPSPGWAGTSPRRSRRPRAHRLRFQERFRELGEKGLPGSSPPPPPRGARRGLGLPCPARLANRGSHRASPAAATASEGALHGSPSRAAGPLRKQGRGPVPNETTAAASRSGPRYLLARRPLQQLRAEIRALPEFPPPEVAPGLEERLRLQPHPAGSTAAAAPAGSPGPSRIAAGRAGPGAERGRPSCCRGNGRPRLGLAGPARRA